MKMWSYKVEGKVKGNTDSKYLFYLSLVIFLPLLVEFVVAVFGPSFTRTLILNALVFGLSFWGVRKNIKSRDIGIILLFYLFMLVNYLFNSDKGDLFFNQKMAMVYVLYIPFCALVVRKITRWDEFFDVFNPIAVFGAIACLVIVFGGSLEYTDSNDEELISYMQFSYFALPIAIGNYVVFRKRVYILNLLFFVSTSMCMLAYGARAAVAAIPFFIIFYEVIRAKVSPFKLTIVASVLAVVGFVILSNLDTIVSYLTGLGVFADSRILTKLATDQLIESDGRDDVMSYAVKGLHQVGISVNGVFGDRQYLGPWSYAHNIVIELILQFGWFFGPIICALLLALILKCCFKSKYNDVCLFFFFGIFFRYFFSGSYITEGRFFIFLTVLLTVWKIGKKSTMYSNNQKQHG